jgi:hypothetical protein
MKQKWPKFDDAVDRFVNFLSSQNWPTEIQWIPSGGILFWRGRMYIRDRSGKTDNQGIYNTGVSRNLGITLNAICHNSNVTWSYVSSPIDREASKRFLYSETDVKLSISQDSFEVSFIRNAVKWFVLKILGKKLGKAPGNDNK